MKLFPNFKTIPFDYTYFLFWGLKGNERVRSRQKLAYIGFILQKLAKSEASSDLPL